LTVMVDPPLIQGVLPARVIADVGRQYCGLLAA